MDREVDFEREVQAEVSRITRDAEWKARRSVIRAARVLAGIALAAAAWWVAAPVLEITSKPISTLSLADLGGFALRVAAALWLITSGGWAAFGEGPDPDELRVAAIGTVRKRRGLSDTSASALPNSETPRTPQATFQSRTSKARPPVVGLECKKCGATYVSAKYCPKCRVSLK